MSWEIWHLSDDGSGKILEIEDYGDDAAAARYRFNDIEQARQAGTWELRRDGTYVALFAVKSPLEVS